MRQENSESHPSGQRTVVAWKALMRSYGTLPVSVLIKGLVFLTSDMSDSTRSERRVHRPGDSWEDTSFSNVH